MAPHDTAATCSKNQSLNPYTSHENYHEQQHVGRRNRFVNGPDRRAGAEEEEKEPPARNEDLRSVRVDDVKRGETRKRDGKETHVALLCSLNSVQEKVFPLSIGSGEQDFRWLAVCAASRYAGSRPHGRVRHREGTNQMVRGNVSPCKQVGMATGRGGPVSFQRLISSCARITRLST